MLSIILYVGADPADFGAAARDFGAADDGVGDSPCHATAAFGTRHALAHRQGPLPLSCYAFFVVDRKGQWQLAKLRESHQTVNIHLSKRPPKNPKMKGSML